MKISLVEYCASDLNVVNAARVSFAQQEAEMNSRNEGLVRFLLRNRHGTPFEHGYFRFHVEAPIFVFREWHRHRIGHSYNEMSGRYVKLEKKFYEPTEFRVQVGKPGAYRYEPMVDAEMELKASSIMQDVNDYAWQAYEDLLDMGVAKEQARTILPVGVYSQMHWSCNPRSLMHFIGLRNAPGALQEIRDLAAEAEVYFEKIMPVTYAAFVANHRTAP